MTRRRGGAAAVATLRGCTALGAATIALAACGVLSAQAPATPSSAASSPRPHSAPANAAIAIHLPRRLLGLKRSPAALSEQLTSIMMLKLRASGSPFVDVKAAVYGRHPSGPVIIMIAVEWSAANKPTSSSSLVPFARGFATGFGASYARSFPAGPKGGVLECGSKPIKGVPVIACGWADQVAAGVAAYLHGAASSLPVAASKTIRVRSAVEG
jgi:hypothetical protein